MYYPIIRQCIQALKNLETWLNKAEKHAAAKKFDVNILITDRLAPDMKPFIYQVQSACACACDYVKAAAAWLRDRCRPSTKTTSGRPLMCVPASGKPLLSRRA
jgi:uncharacterized protein